MLERDVPAYECASEPREPELRASPDRDSRPAFTRFDALFEIFKAESPRVFRTRFPAFVLQMIFSRYSSKGRSSRRRVSERPPDDPLPERPPLRAEIYPSDRKTLERSVKSTLSTVGKFTSLFTHFLPSLRSALWVRARKHRFPLRSTFLSFLFLVGRSIAKRSPRIFLLVSLGARSGSTGRRLLGSSDVVWSEREVRESRQSSRKRKRSRCRSLSRILVAVRVGCYKRPKIVSDKPADPQTTGTAERTGTPDVVSAEVRPK